MKRLVKPELTCVQLLPLSVERKTPSFVPAKTSLPLTASAAIVRFVKPLLTAFHDAPLSVEIKTPPPLVAVNRFDPLASISMTVALQGPLERVQSASDLVGRNASAPRAAQKNKTDFFIGF